ncbi:MAG: polyprenyl synthetase family protein [Turicibacter sp.]|nr:polyprenyl synthetase family protein [Turicibacter sp.]
MDKNIKRTIDERMMALVDKCANPDLKEAMLYSILAGGKRIRPALLLGVCETIIGRYSSCALDFACALEMIHTYSLIHDDLPAMDNDDFRRGMPTNHKQFGEAMAILAGDALLNRAFETMADVCFDEPTLQNIRAMQIITAAAGDNGMISGQVKDILLTTKRINLKTLLDIHRQKTGAMFAAAFEAGAVLGGANEHHTAQLRDLGYKLGLAFQMLDDLLDVVSTEQELGKPINSDISNDKDTYVTICGIDQTHRDYKKIAKEIFAMLEKLPKNREFAAQSKNFQELIEQTLNRGN